MPNNLNTAGVDMPSQFGATVKDAEQLLRKASFCCLFVHTGEDVALFEIPKQIVLKNLEYMPRLGPLPCELDFNDHRGPKLIFGGVGAIENARRPA